MIDQVVNECTTADTGIVEPANNNCNAADIAVQLLSHKWTIPIILELFTGPKRPCDLERKLKGLSAKTLAERLHHLQQAGIITRQSFSEIPPRVEYSLTELGMNCKPLIGELDQYGKYWQSKMAEVMFQKAN